MLEDCLKNLVGLSRSDCSCFEDDRPADFQTSLSGLYIADELNLSVTNSAADCEKGGVWDILETSRDRAINEFVMDYMHGIQSRYGDAFTPFYSSNHKDRFIGKNNISSAKINPVSNVAAMKINPRCIKGGVLTIEGVELALNNIQIPTSVDVKLFKSNDLINPIDTATINLTAQKTFFYAAFSKPIRIDLSDSDYDNSELYYYLAYQIPQGATIPRAKIYEGCNCSKGSILKYNVWAQYISIDGVSAIDFENLDKPRYSNSYTMGLRIKATASCDRISWLCELANDFNELLTLGDKDFKYASDLAYTINSRAKEIVLDTILRSPNINRLTMFAKDSVRDLRNRYRKQYAGYLQWMINNIPLHRNDCLTCHNDRSVSKNTILI